MSGHLIAEDAERFLHYHTSVDFSRSAIIRVIRCYRDPPKIEHKRIVNHEGLIRLTSAPACFHRNERPTSASSLICSLYPRSPSMTSSGRERCCGTSRIQRILPTYPSNEEQHGSHCRMELFCAPAGDNSCMTGTCALLCWRSACRRRFCDICRSLLKGQRQRMARA